MKNLATSMHQDIDKAFAYCLYCIECEPTGRRYVGRTANFLKRKYSHLCALIKGTHVNLLMQDDFLQHGAESFTIRMLGWYMQSVDVSMAEGLAINYYMQIGKSYNILAPNPIKIETRYGREERWRRKLDALFYKHLHYHCKKLERRADCIWAVQ